MTSSCGVGRWGTRDIYLRCTEPWLRIRRFGCATTVQQNREDGAAPARRADIGDIRSRRPGVGCPGIRAARQLDLQVGARLPDSVEVAANYVVAEAPTNAAEHARASEVSVVVDAEGPELSLLIGDDGIGGALSDRGSGLVGLTDRVEALPGATGRGQPGRRWHLADRHHSHRPTPEPADRWATGHAVRARVAGPPARFLTSGTAVEMTASPG